MDDCENYVVSLKQPVTGSEIPAGISSVTSISMVTAGVASNTHSPNVETLIGMFPCVHARVVSGPGVVLEKALNYVAVSALGMVMSFSQGQPPPIQFSDSFLASKRRRTMRKRRNRLFEPADVPVPAVMFADRERFFAAYPPTTGSFFTKGELRREMRRRFSDFGKK